MKKLIYISLIGFLLTTGCKKDKSISTASTLPFENDNIKLELVTTSAPSSIRDIFFFNASTGIAVSYDGKIYKTTDNGSNWVQILNHQNGFYGLNPLTANSCLVFGAGVYSGGDFGTWNGEIIQTTNAGSNWTETELGGIEPIRYTSFYSATEGYAVAGSKLIKVTVK